MSSLSAEIKYTILTDLLNSCCSRGQRSWEMTGYRSYSLSFILLHHFIYAEMVYMNIVIFCNEKFTFIYISGDGFEPEIL
jgi:hypothetical protein